MAGLCHFIAGLCHFMAGLCLFMAGLCHFMAGLCHFMAGLCHFMAGLCHFMASLCHFMAVSAVCYTFGNLLAISHHKHANVHLRTTNVNLNFCLIKFMLTLVATELKLRISFVLRLGFTMTHITKETAKMKKK